MKTTRRRGAEGIRLLLAAIFLASPALALVTYLGTWSGDGLTALAVATAAGVSAYVYLLNLFIIGTRPGLLARYVGEEGLLRFHVAVALLSTLLAAVHGSVKALAFASLSPQVQSGYVAFVALLGVAAIGLSTMLGPLLRRSAGAASSAVGARAWTTLRHLGAAAVLLALFHVFLASTTLATSARTVVMGGWFAAAVGAYAYRALREPRRRSVAAAPEPVHSPTNPVTAGRPGSGGVS